MEERLRYVIRKPNRDGTLRFYWQRRGHPITRLPDDLTARVRMAEALNRQADNAPNTEALPDGSIGWVVNEYKLSGRRYARAKAYTELAGGTLKYYNRYLRDIEELGKTLPFAIFDRRMVIDFCDGYEGNDNARKAGVVLQNLFECALYNRVGGITENCATKLGIPRGAPRSAVWFQEHIDAWLEAARMHPKGAAMADTLMLLIYTAQRASDVLKMKRLHVRDNGTVLVKQMKTGKLVPIPIHKLLRPTVDKFKDAEPGLFLVTWEGRQMSYKMFNQAWREITVMAGLSNVVSPDGELMKEIGGIDDYGKLQARDLRRTAVVRMHEAGCSLKMISSITGHSIDECQKIIETYLPTTAATQRMAIRRWEESDASDEIDI